MINLLYNGTCRPSNGRPHDSESSTHGWLGNMSVQSTVDFNREYRSAAQNSLLVSMQLLYSSDLICKTVGQSAASSQFAKHFWFPLVIPRVILHIVAIRRAHLRFYYVIIRVRPRFFFFETHCKTNAVNGQKGTRKKTSLARVQARFTHY